MPPTKKRKLGGNILLPPSTLSFRLFGQIGPSSQNCAVMEYKIATTFNISVGRPNKKITLSKRFHGSPASFFMSRARYK